MSHWQAVNRQNPIDGSIRFVGAFAGCNADEGRIAAEDALVYRSRHGLYAELRTEERGRDTVEETLERIAKASARAIAARAPGF